MTNKELDQIISSAVIKSPISADELATALLLLKHNPFVKIRVNAQIKMLNKLSYYGFETEHSAYIVAYLSKVALSKNISLNKLISDVKYSNNTISQYKYKYGRICLGGLLRLANK